jgi:lysophospholipase
MPDMYSAHPTALAAIDPQLGDPPPSISFLDLPDGAHLRHACWEPASAPKATLLMLNGRSEFIEKYDELARSWTDRGYRVFSLDWRGQGLSTRPLPQRERHYVKDFGEFADDLAFFVDRVVLPRRVGPSVMYAHSMGGHIATRYLATESKLYDAVVLSAPMAGFATGALPNWAVRPLARNMVAAGLATSYAFGHGDYDPAKQNFVTNPVTHDIRRWAIHHQWYRVNPELRVGGVTWGWIDAAFRSIDVVMNTPETTAAVDLPILLLSPGQDTLILPGAHEALSRLYRNCRLVKYPDARHEVMMETDDIRSRAWADIDHFLGKALEGQC